MNNKTKYVAKVGRITIGTFDTYQEAFNALPEVEINECFCNKKKIGFIYKLTNENSKTQNEKGERTL